MREFVAIGAPKQIADFREHWIARAPEIAGALGLSPRSEAASDPFFGRLGAMVGRFEMTPALKIRDARAYSIGGIADRVHAIQLSPRSLRTDLGPRSANLEAAHTACVAFGVDRLAVALFATHGSALPSGRRRWGSAWRCETDSSPKARVVQIGSFECITLSRKSEVIRDARSSHFDPTACVAFP
jgi:hypothetical protein